MTSPLFYFFITINVVTFLLFGIDKYKAKHKRWRIPEAHLLWISFLGGAAGGFLGMKIFHHKTLHSKFNLCIPIFLILHLIICAFLYQL